MGGRRQTNYRNFRFSHRGQITGSVRGEIARSMFFLQPDLSSIIGIEATAVLQLPDGVEVDESLANISVQSKTDRFYFKESVLYWISKLRSYPRLWD